jgi:hypothetical protein
MFNEIKPYPSKVCQDCGHAASGGRQREISCWHQGKCDVCGESKVVTEVRDFFYPEFPGHTRGRTA